MVWTSYGGLDSTDYNKYTISLQFERVNIQVSFFAKHQCNFKYLFQNMHQSLNINEILIYYQHKYSTAYRYLTNFLSSILKIHSLNQVISA